MSRLTSPMVPVSWGELLDKLTILEIKRARIEAADARANVEREWQALDAIGAPAAAQVSAEVERLRAVNEALWDIEDRIRAEEARGLFGPDFVALARAVYHRNDERAAIKRAINRALGSDLVEEKSYWSAT